MSAAQSVVIFVVDEARVPLSDMVLAALDALETDPDGFFLVVEAARDDMLVVLTADHETGGLSVSGQVSPGVVPADSAVAWSTGGHTATAEPISRAA